jgi:SAM-dependent methyltransferase
MQFEEDCRLQLPTANCQLTNPSDCREHCYDTEENAMGMIDNKVAIITGATSGIGARTAELFVAEGANVVFTGRREAEGKALAAKLGGKARFIQADAHDLDLDGPFDVIILSDLVNGLWNVQKLFEDLAPLCLPSTRVIINTYSRVWELPFLMSLGFFGFTIFNVALYSALKYTSAINASITLILDGWRQ